ncbi:MEDS domain-containing protein [Domibacillus enclensis]|uniref:MEDS: MEthanogen/methylotroph, DcmR Sensory domain n=1 Tax=Domibacillus enclensis TaxID=1017273 RepID=A0A1N6Y630_9BACI|nr:MEDS domain-containing protein [Domibacillus enclensis]OXS77532.1 hypothetical protein B1B05_11895 [Domibacillus enclensis]SIR10082.1 MEDS: MEthanogen/methylotroph, DcmR Sensory domain [Domibacillus enclensis]
MREQNSNETEKPVHIAYCFASNDSYIHNVVEYIKEGIEKGEHVLLVENKKCLALIQAKLHAIFTDQQLQRLHAEDNFDFYFSNQTFDPGRILGQFHKSTELYVNQGVRTWGHVEWGTADNAQHVGVYEKRLSERLSCQPITAVCAYNEDRVLPDLKKVLHETHDYVMTDADWKNHAL